MWQNTPCATANIWNQCSVCSFPAPYGLGGPGKQIIEDFAFVYFQHIELLSYFPIDAAMHPVLKNLGIADKVISFIFESVNGNKVKKKKQNYAPILNKNRVKYILYICVVPCVTCERIYWGISDRKMKRSVLIKSDRPCSALIFALKLFETADCVEALKSEHANKGNFVACQISWTQ